VYTAVDFLSFNQSLIQFNERSESGVSVGLDWYPACSAVVRESVCVVIVLMRNTEAHVRSVLNTNTGMKNKNMQHLQTQEKSIWMAAFIFELCMTGYHLLAQAIAICLTLLQYACVFVCYLFEALDCDDKMKVSLRRWLYGFSSTWKLQ